MENEWNDEQKFVDRKPQMDNYNVGFMKFTTIKKFKVE